MKMIYLLMKIVILFLMGCVTSELIPLNEVEFCPTLIPGADIEVYEITESHPSHVTQGDIVRSTIKFRLKSGVLKTGKIRTEISKYDIRFPSFEFELNDHLVNKKMPLTPDVYLIDVSQKIPSIIPPGLYNTVTKVILNGRSTICILKDIDVLKKNN